MKTFFLVFIILFLLGCGSSSSNPQSSVPIVKNTAPEPYFYQQWYLAKDNAFYASNQIDNDANIHPSDILEYYKGRGVKIAVIDDGCDIYHEDLINAITKTFDIATRTTDVSHTLSKEFHGTAVTGLIGARVNSKGIKGVANEAEILFLKYKENMSDSETIELFLKAEAFGADIINNSWGTYNVSPAVRDTIVSLSKNGRGGKGIVIVFASGNDDRDMGNDESAIPEVISVGATDRENLRAFYSNFGVNLDIMAPGGYWIGLTTLDESLSRGIASKDENYILYDDANSFTGTSGAAPIVSGIIGLMLEKNPNLTKNEIENILKNTADKVGNVPYSNKKNLYYGYGKVNLTNAMDGV